MMSRRKVSSFPGKAAWFHTETQAEALSDGGAGDGNRTRDTSLEGWSIATMQHPRAVENSHVT